MTTTRILPPAETIRALRASFHMTQTQLAKRAGLPQSHLARVESGKVDPQLNTLRKIMSALYCEVLFVPRVQGNLSAILEGKIKEKARRNVARVLGTMALERQEPDDKTARALILSEEARLRAHPSSEIWAD